MLNFRLSWDGERNNYIVHEAPNAAEALAHFGKALGMRFSYEDTADAKAFALGIVQPGIQWHRAVREIVYGVPVSPSHRPASR